MRLFYSASVRNLLIFALDMVLAVWSLCAASYPSQGMFLTTLQYYTGGSVFLLLSTAVFLYVFDCCNLTPCLVGCGKTRGVVFLCPVLAVLSAAVLSSSFYYLSHFWFLPVSVLIPFVFLCSTLLVAVRGLAVAHLSLSPRRIVLVKIKGCGTNVVENLKPFFTVSKLVKLDELTERDVQDVDMVVADSTVLSLSEADRLYRITAEKAVPVFSLQSLSEMALGRVPLETLTNGCVPADLSGAKEWDRLKRVMDAAAASIGLLISLPVMLLVALVVYCQSPGSVLIKQRRVGKGGKEFTLYKLRTMVLNAEAENRPEWTERGDKRVLPLCGIVRKLHLDELPQLWNVLKGEMSLVGPRPERPEFVELLSREIPPYFLRHLVKPGLTGWAQINQPYAGSVEEAEVKLEYDLFYIKRRSIGLDISILLKTIGSVLTLQGR